MSEKDESRIRRTNIRISSSIGRASRFYSEILNPIPGPGMYDINEKPQSTIKFALSKRSPLFQVPDSPSPGEYNIPSCFDRSKGRSFTFSPKLSRSIPKYPGPGEYNAQIVTNVSARPVFGKEKRKDNFLNVELINVPGPGKYSYRSTLQGPTWKFGTEKSRKHKEIEESPGPGAYDISPMREHIVFKFPSGRKNERIPTFPGPGQYSVNTPKSTSFSIPKAEKFQKFTGQVLPGPSDYFVQESSINLTPKSIRKDSGSTPRSVKKNHPYYEKTFISLANSNEVLKKDTKNSLPYS